jgi:hypothetical protein
MKGVEVRHVGEGDATNSTFPPGFFHDLASPTRTAATAQSTRPPSRRLPPGCR